MRRVVTRQHPDTARANRLLHRLLIDGVPVEYTADDGTKKADQARLIDFTDPAANDLLVVNQFVVQGTKSLRRPDLVVFVNGLPLAVIELKNPADQDADVWKAFHQLQTYKAEIGDLFLYNAALVVSDGVTARVGSLTASPEWFMPWRTVDGPDDKPTLEFELEKIVRGFFRPDLLLDYVRYFVLFEEDSDNIVKKIAGYHQFHGVREAVRVTMIASQHDAPTRLGELRADYGERVEPGSGKAGVFWHTQGSGKSISMAMYAGKLLQQPAMRNPTLVVVTDRNDLDGQLFGQFSAARELLRQAPEQAEGRDELRELLQGRRRAGSSSRPCRSSHRWRRKTHTRSVRPVERGGDQRRGAPQPVRAEAALDKKTGKYVYGFAKHMRDALPNASFIGFTGTPIEHGGQGHPRRVRRVRQRLRHPGRRRGRRDGADLLREPAGEAGPEPGPDRRLNEQMDEEVVEEEEEALAEREKTKSKWAQLAKLVGAKPRLEAMAKDLVEHITSGGPRRSRARR